jgi:hypothetical protein
MLDLTESIAPKSDQMNADDLMSGPRTFTIADVRKASSAEQPFDFLLAEFPRPFKPSKSMRRVMVLAWGKDASAYVGRRFTLYRDPTVKWAGSEIGGIRISAMSHIPEPLTMALTVTRGKREPYRVDVLPDQASPELLAELAAMFERKGIHEGARLAGVNRITGGSATDLEVITEDEARKVLHALQSRPDVEGGEQ